MAAILYFLLAAAFIAAGFRANWIFWIVGAIFLWAGIATLFDAM